MYFGSPAKDLLFSATASSGWLATIRNSDAIAWLANGLFCLSLWISLVAAIWMSRGWIGLFFSGQILSAGTYLIQRLFRRTQYAFCTNNGPSHELDGEHNAR
jgi:hypothetical protein